ncbi:hypothetical protein NLG97_g7713 [Lecanicillium saksenae]|uniref:Uncharacterized protein n=1 Tax=Lecanicillium saksenae TaxID=468837 RepID=A0ACC1QP78_9HYPO|nr:hypothetical protein NLG97_g7713 [Lecanicillium saksenae]
MPSSKSPSSTLPFGQHVALADISGPTYVTAQLLVQQIAYKLSDKIFAYSPETPAPAPAPSPSATSSRPTLT